jgi:hypothetical protein
MDIFIEISRMGIMNNAVKISFDKLRDRMFSYEFMIKSRVRPEYFTRKSPLDFKTMMLQTMKLVKKSMQIEINNLFDELNKETVVSKQAFSKARQKIRWEAFKELYEETVDTAFKCDEIKYFKGKYRLLAVDGATVPLESTKDLIEHFGCSGGSKTACTARVSVLQDVYYGILYDAVMSSYRVGERKLAIQHLEKLKTLDDRENIVMFDRGYVSNELIANCFELGHFFVMRIKSRWHENLIEKAQTGDWVSIKHDGAEHQVRVIKLTLPNGNTQVLFSNIDFLDISDFGELYALRWTIETRYDVIKNIIQLENTSGLTVTSILQDFFACMTIANLLAFTKLGADEVIAKNNKGKNLKREYQASNTMIIGALRQYFVRIIITDNPLQRRYYADKFFDFVTRFSDVVQPHRSYPRINKTERRHFPLRKKSVM